MCIRGRFIFSACYTFMSHGGPSWSEGLIVALAAGRILWQRCADGLLLLRLIAFYTFWLTLIYTVLPYKTPWCLLGFYHGMILLAGAGAVLLWRACRTCRVEGGGRGSVGRRTCRPWMAILARQFWSGFSRRAVLRQPKKPLRL